MRHFRLGSLGLAAQILFVQNPQATTSVFSLCTFVVLLMCSVFNLTQPEYTVKADAVGVFIDVSCLTLSWCGTDLRVLTRFCNVLLFHHEFCRAFLWGE